MASRREHHFVPRFYLREWSDDGRSIRLFNLKRERLIETASIRAQCSKRNLYGEDTDLEDMFAEIEAPVASILRRLKDGNIPTRFSSDHILLTVYVALQSARTVAAFDDEHHRVNQLIAAVYRGTPEGRLFEEGTISLESSRPGIYTLAAAAKSSPLLGDLMIYVIQNNTETPFHTSDHPVVRYNLFLEKGLSLGTGVLGLMRRGLLIFLPLGPRHTLALIDGTTYKVGSGRRTGLLSATEDDVAQLNRLQWVTANHNVFAASSVDSPVLIRQFQQNIRHRLAAKTIVHELVHVGEERWVRRDFVDPAAIEQPERTMLHQASVFPRLGLKFSFLSLRRSARRRKATTDLSGLMLEVRSPWTWDAIEALTDGDWGSG